MNCPQQTVTELWETVFGTFEDVRKTVFVLITGNKDRENDAKSLMLKAYLEFSAVSDTTKYDNEGKPIGPVTRSRWPDLVNDNAKNHNEKYNAML